MTTKVRYVGSAPAEILDTQYKFTTYGQSVGMPEDLFNLARAGRIHLITEEQFQSLGHTPQELATFSRFETHVNPTPEFLERLRQAWRICQEPKSEEVIPSA